MLQALPTPVSFDEFIAWYPENSGTRYELHDGFIVEMPNPTGQHSKIAGFIAGELFLSIRQAQFPYFIPRECVVKALDESGYKPDVIVLDDDKVLEEPRWERQSIITKGESVRLIIEVVSTNWRDDYLTKLADYEELAIPEYWVVDYAALGGRRFIGNPKQPTIGVYTLIDGEYQVQQFRGDDRIASRAFPDLGLTANQIFAVR